jgi:hypothetical protein
VNLLIVSRGFRVLGLLLGVPSGLLFLDLFMNLFVFPTRMPPPDHSPPLDIQKYGIAGLLSYGAKGMGMMFMALGTLAEWAAELLAVIMFFVMLFSLLLFFAGRGMAHHAGWARVMGFVLAALFLLTWLGILSVANQYPGIAVACVGVAMSLYAIWVLGWRYA